MPSKLSVTAIRIFTASVLIPVVVALVWLAPTSVVAVLSATVILFALLEFFTLGDLAGLRGYRVWTGFCAIAIFFMQWLSSAERTLGVSVPTPTGRIPEVAEAFSVEIILIVFVLGCTVIILFTRRPVNESLGGLSISAAAMIFLVLPFSAVVRLHGSGPEGRKLLLFTLALVWAGDTLAYFVGRSVGRRKMAPQLSPKKTWAGAAANLVGSILVAVVAQRWLHIPIYHLILMASLANIAGQAGDLLESAYKRSAGSKDSGTLLPGHGGMLDRIDALVLAAPVVWYYFSWIVNRGA
jgi:phosphatidate cytidylyltransferase